MDFRMKKPYVIAIAGFVGSGKSTVAAGLSRRLEEAPVLSFDHYEKYVEWPQDIDQWIERGADPNQIRIPRLKADLLLLCDGMQVTDPLDGRTIPSSRYILLEEPSGRERDEIKEHINLVVYIDVPKDICVTRMIQRLLDMDAWKSQGTFAEQRTPDLVRQLDTVASWITHYQRVRTMYVSVSRKARLSADLVVNGMADIEETTNVILSVIRGKKEAESTGRRVNHETDSSPLPERQ